MPPTPLLKPLNALRTVVVLLFFVLVGCGGQSVAESALPQLNGYWEIESVEFPNGDKKTYTVNTNIDFISLEDGRGYRKKVQPKLDGSYLTSKDAEPFEITEKEGRFTMTYQSGNESWEEVLLTLSTDSFSVKNQGQLIYTYKRYEPINLNQ